MNDLIRLLGRSTLAGAVSGARSLTAVAALTLTADRGAREQPDRILGRPGARGAASLGAAAELVADKLPATPSRLEPAGLLPRIAAGAACGVIISRRALGRGPLTLSAGPVSLSAGTVAQQAGTMAACGLAGASVAGASAWLGSRWRAFAAPRLGRDWIGALIEDAVAVTLAAVAACAD